MTQMIIQDQQSLKERNKKGRQTYGKIFTRTPFLKIFSAVLAVLIWELASFTLPSTILPGPWITATTLWKNFIEGQLTVHFLSTMNRVFLSLALAMLLGTVVGAFMGLSRKMEHFMDLWVMVALTIPGLCYTIVFFMWFGLNELATVIAITITAVPSITINIWEGVKSIDNRLIDMAKVFNAPRRDRLREVVIPQVLPYIMASFRYGLGIIWKVTVLVELLGRSSGVGYMLNYWFQMYNMPQVFAWTLFFILIMLFLELVVIKQLEVKLFAWRPKVKF